MKISKTQLKRIIREEYKRILAEDHVHPYADILDLASRPDGVSLDEINSLFGAAGFDIIDELTEEGIVWLDDQEGIVYASGSKPSAGLKGAVDRYTRR